MPRTKVKGVNSAAINYGDLIIAISRIDLDYLLKAEISNGMQYKSLLTLLAERLGLLDSDGRRPGSDDLLSAQDKKKIITSIKDRMNVLGKFLRRPLSTSQFDELCRHPNINFSAAQRELFFRFLDQHGARPSDDASAGAEQLMMTNRIAKSWRAGHTYGDVIKALSTLRFPKDYTYTRGMQNQFIFSSLAKSLQLPQTDPVKRQRSVQDKMRYLAPLLMRLTMQEFHGICEDADLLPEEKVSFREFLDNHGAMPLEATTNDTQRMFPDENLPNSSAQQDHLPSQSSAVPANSREAPTTAAKDDVRSDDDISFRPSRQLASPRVLASDQHLAPSSGEDQESGHTIRRISRSEAFVRYLIEFASDTAIDECDIWLDRPELIPIAANRLSETLLDVLEVLSLRPDLIEIVQWKTLGTHRVVNAILGLDEHQKINSVRGRQIKQRLKELDRIAQTGLLVFDAVTKYMDLSDRNREDFKRFMIESGRHLLPAPAVPPTFDFSFQNAFKQPLFAITWINDANHNEAESSAGYWSGNFYGGIVVSYETCDGFAQQFNCGSLAEKLNTIYRGLPESLQLHIVSTSFLEKHNLMMGQHYLVDASLREVFSSLADTHGLTAKQVCAKIGQDCLLWLSLDERLPDLVETAHQREHESVQQRRRTTMPNANDLKQLRQFSDLLLLFVHLTLLDFGFTLVQIEWILRVLQTNYNEMRKRSRLTYDDFSDSSSDDQSIWSSQRTLSNESVPQSPSAREEQFPSRSNDDVSFRPPGHLASRCVLGSDQSLASSSGQIQESFRQDKSQRVIQREIRTGPASPKKWTL